MGRAKSRAVAVPRRPAWAVSVLGRLPSAGKLTPLLVTIAFVLVMAAVRNRAARGMAAAGRTGDAGSDAFRANADAGRAKKVPPQKWEIEVEAFEMLEEKRAAELQRKREQEMRSLAMSSNAEALPRKLTSQEKREKYERIRRARLEREAEEERIAEANRTPAPPRIVQPPSAYEPVGHYSNPYKHDSVPFVVDGPTYQALTAQPDGAAPPQDDQAGTPANNAKAEASAAAKPAYEGHKSFMEWFKDAKEVQGVTSKEICPDGVKECTNMVRWFRKHKARVVIDSDCLQSLPWLSHVVDILSHELWGFRYVCSYSSATLEQLRSEAPRQYQMLHDVVSNHVAMGPSLRFEDAASASAGGSVSAGGETAENASGNTTTNASGVDKFPVDHSLARTVEIDLRPWNQHDFMGVDIVFCREGFAFTKSYQRIWRFLSLVQAARVKLILVDNYPSISNVGDSSFLWRPGGMRVVNVLRAPFNLPKPKTKVRGLTASPKVMSALIEAKPDEFNETTPPIPKHLLLYNAEFVEYILDKSPDRDLVWASRLEEMYAD